jgi:hypothetical protein
MTPPSSAVVPFAAWLGTWSRPPDRPAQAALALAAALLTLALVPRGTRWLASIVDLSSIADLRRWRRFLTVASFAAAFLSLGYIAFYLRGGPRAPEASTYWLQGRALSHGALSWAIPDPTASFVARDLVFRPPDRLSGVFPPGYPLLLAMGFLVGAPMLVGPLLAAALVVATWLLAHEVVADADAGDACWRDKERKEAIARTAVGLSVVSAALRYHTADALPHGATALAVATSLACALRARRTHDVRLFGAAGLAIGFLIASVPVSALSVGVIVAALAWGAPGRHHPGFAGARSKPETVRSLAWTCAAALPGVLLLLAANRAATGHVLASPAAAYAAAAGAVSRPVAAPLALSALRCAREHLVDIANLEPLALLALVPVVGSGRLRGAVLTALVVAGQIAARALVRFDAAHAGAGAGLLVGVVPLEHVLIAVGVARLSPRAFAPASVATLALALAGFAVHASHAHEARAASDLGRPRFEPDVPREANITHGLLFFDDDTGYELAHDPGVGASHGIEAARMRGDDHDRLLYDSLGHPPTHHYVIAATSASVPVWTPPNAGSDTWTFEAENDWPIVAQVGGGSEAVDVDEPCASNGRVLRVTPAMGRLEAEASMTLALPLPQAPAPGEKRMWIVTPRVLERANGGNGVIALVVEPGQPPLAEWSWTDSSALPTCVDLPARAVELGGQHTHARLVVRAQGGPVEVDKTTFRPG